MNIPLAASAHSFDGIPNTWKGKHDGVGTLRWCWRSIDRDRITVLGIVARYDYPAGVKEVIPFFQPDGKGGWKKEHPKGKKRPLFGMHTLDRPGPVFICEGEKDTTALHEIGLAAVTSPGGCQQAHYADWSVLADVPKFILWPDADAPGAKYADKVIAILAQLPNSRMVSRVDPAGLGLKDGEGAADWLMQRTAGWDGFLSIQREPGDTDLVDILLESVDNTSQPVTLASVNRPEEPIPLLSSDEQQDSFPVEALGPLLGSAAIAIHETIQAPLGMCCNSVLAAAALASQAHADVMIKSVGRNPIAEFFLTVGESGERKSAVDRVALLPVRRFEAELRRLWAAAENKFRCEMEAYTAAKKRIVNSRRQSSSFRAVADALEELGPPPEQPPLPVRAISDMTIEGLFLSLGRGLPSAGIFTDEGGTWVGGNGLLPENILKTLAGFSELWDGHKPQTRVRAGDGTTILAGRRVSMHVMMQGCVASMLLEHRLANGQGFLGRCLCCWPESTLGRRMFNEHDLFADPRVLAYDARLYELLAMPVTLRPGTTCELDPDLLLVEGEALAIWVAFHDRIERALHPNGEYYPVKALAAKTAQHAIRIAGILCVVEGGEIDADRMRRGCVLAEFYLREALRIKANGTDMKERSDADRMLAWIRTTGANKVCMRDACRNGPADLRKVEDVRRVFKLLGEFGYLLPAVGERDTWIVVSNEV